MKTSILKFIPLIFILLALVSFDLPKGWIIAGSKPNSYEIGIDTKVTRNNSRVALIKSIDKKIKGFGTLMQQSKPDKFLGKRVRMSGYIKSENVANWAGLWLRVDQSSKNPPLSFDNMNDRPIKGTNDWTRHEIVLDVPSNASLIAFGVLLHGTGTVWIDDISFEIVGNSIKTSGSINEYIPLSEEEPNNLDFEK